MKFLKKISITLFFALLTIITIQAQRPDGNRSGRDRNPVERANAQSERMITALELSTAQGEKIRAVNLAFAEKMLAAREAATAEDDWSSMREGMKSLRTEQKEAISKYLTAEQIEKWTKLQEASPERGRRQGKGKRKKQGEKKSN